MSYLAQLSARASAPAPSVPSLRPAFRSQSPIAEADQRIGATEHDFDGLVPSSEEEHSLVEPIESPAPLGVNNVANIGPAMASGPIPNLTGGANMGESFLGSIVSSKPVNAPPPGDQSSNWTNETRPTLPPANSTSNEAMPSSPEPQSPVGFDQLLRVETHKIFESLESKAAAPDTSTAQPAAVSYLDAVPVAGNPAAELTPASSPGPQVVIDQLVVEVVPPPGPRETTATSNQAKADSQSTQSSPQAPVSLIGPLGNSVSSQVRYGLRYR